MRDTMHRLIEGFMFLVIFIFGVFLGYKFSGIDKLYPNTAVVAMIDYDHDLMMVEDSSGFRYFKDSPEDFQIGDVVSMLMKDTGKGIRSDEIKLMWYAGYVDKQFILNSRSDTDDSDHRVLHAF